MTTDTPRTDALLHAVQCGFSRFSFPEHARQLERELNQWRICAERLAGCFDGNENIAESLTAFRILKKADEIRSGMKESP